MGAWQVNKLAQDLRRPEMKQAYKENADAVMDQYGLTEEEKHALKSGGRAEWNHVGMHPILQVVFLQIKSGAAGMHISVKEYLDELDLNRP